MLLEGKRLNAAQNLSDLMDGRSDLCSNSMTLIAYESDWNIGKTRREVEMKGEPRGLRGSPVTQQAS
jgi:hypothetical protein